MTNEIRWFRCIWEGRDLTVGKLYPATTTDCDGDLVVVDDVGDTQWVVITESYAIAGEINEHFEEVIPDEND